MSWSHSGLEHLRALATCSIPVNFDKKLVVAGGLVEVMNLFLTSGLAGGEVLAIDLMQMSCISGCKESLDSSAFITGLCSSIADRLLTGLPNVGCD